MSGHAVFVTGRNRSLGETYTLARFARALRRAGWTTRFLAFEYAAGFLAQQGETLDVLGGDQSTNEAVLRRVVRAAAPDLVVTADYFLLTLPETAAVWSNQWLFDLGCPVASFDHMGYHPHRCRVSLAFDRRMAAMPPKLTRSWRAQACHTQDVANALPERPSLASPPPVRVQIDSLPPQVAALIRSCPIHDPRPAADPRLFAFCAPAWEPQSPSTPAAVRARFGVSSHERLVLLPVGGWCLELCRELALPFLDHAMRLLLRYLASVPAKVRLVLLDGESAAYRESHGSVTVERLASLPFDVMGELTRSADLVLTFNVVSSSMARAVLSGVPSAAVVNSVERDPQAGAPRFAAAFPLSPASQGALVEMEERAPGSVFPFSVFPLGLRQEVGQLLDRNPYAQAFEQLEIFDEGATRAALERLLCDEGWRGQLRSRQEQYSSFVEKLPEPGMLAEDIVARAEMQPWL